MDKNKAITVFTVGDMEMYDGLIGDRKTRNECLFKAATGTVFFNLDDAIDIAIKSELSQNKKFRVYEVETTMGNIILDRNNEHYCLKDNAVIVGKNGVMSD